MMTWPHAAQMSHPRSSSCLICRRRRRRASRGGVGQVGVRRRGRGRGRGGVRGIKAPGWREGLDEGRVRCIGVAPSRFPHAGHFMSSAMAARRRQPHAAGRLATSRSDPSPPPGPQPPEDLAASELAGESVTSQLRFTVRVQIGEEWLSTPVNGLSLAPHTRGRRARAGDSFGVNLRRAPGDSRIGFQRL